jgi:hypothetical protein
MTAQRRVRARPARRVRRRSPARAVTPRHRPIPLRNPARCRANSMRRDARGCLVWKSLPYWASAVRHVSSWLRAWAWRVSTEMGTPTLRDRQAAFRVRRRVRRVTMYGRHRARVASGASETPSRSPASPASNKRAARESVRSATRPVLPKVNAAQCAYRTRIIAMPIAIACSWTIRGTAADVRAQSPRACTKRIRVGTNRAKRRARMVIVINSIAPS